MADSRKGRIYVESDYDNIVLIDPNKLIIGNKIVDRLVDHEDMVFYANLETKVIPRTKLAVGEGFGSQVSNTLIASIQGDSQPFESVNFLKPKGKNFFDTSWSDQITGRGSRLGRGSNQTTQSYQEVDGAVRRLRNVTNYEDTQMFGIKKIDVNITPNGGPGSFVPEVSISMVDINGRTLFEQGENSIYSVFFNMPYPIFYLTLKGYYGKAIRYTLQMTDFSCSFDQGTGNFEIQIKLTSNLLSLLQDTTLGYAKTAPKMFPTLVQQSKNTNNSPDNSQTRLKNVEVVLGKQKLNEVYQIYESKGLIPKNFPRITIDEFMLRTDNFVIDVEKDIENGEFFVFNDIENFRLNLNELKTNSFDEIKGTFLDLENFIIINGERYYTFQERIGYGIREDVLKAIDKETETAIQKLKANEAFGDNGKYKLGKNEYRNQNIPVGSKTDYKVFETNIAPESLTDADIKNTYKARYNKQLADSDYAVERNKIISKLKALGVVYDKNKKTFKPDENPVLFHFGEKLDPLDTSFTDNSFLFKINKIETQLSKNVEDIEKKFTELLAKRFVEGKDGKGGLGFEPTIRNIFAVIIAGCDVFYRLMDDTHKEAWNKRNDPKRIKSVMPFNNNSGVDSKNNVTYAGRKNEQNVVYPWPTYLVQAKDKDNREVFNIEYVGDPKYENKTNGLDYYTWPEVYFTENFLDANVRRGGTLADQSAYNNPGDFSDFASCDAIEFPFKKIPYESTAEVEFFTELFDRVFMLANYSGFFSYPNIDIGTPQVLDFLAELESNNISVSVSNNFTLQQKLKQPGFTSSQLTALLQSFTTLWAQEKLGNFATTYIQNYIDDNFKIYSINTIGSSSVVLNNTTPLKDKFKKFIEQPNIDNFYLTDTREEYNTTEEIFIFLDDKKTLARLDKTEKISNINLFDVDYVFVFANKNLGALETTSSTTINSRNVLFNYYENYTDSVKSTCRFFEYSDSFNLSKKANQSLLNTPYFINALLKGIDNQKNNYKNPYVALGYIYLNSLYINSIENSFRYFDANNKQVYIPVNIKNTFKKFGAIHQLPYPFILKYGAIWHRYKNYVENKKDILEGIIENFNYKKYYDLSGNNLEREYKIKDYNGNPLNFKSYKKEVDPNNASKFVDILNVGFYPYIINDINYYVTNGEVLFENYDDIEFSKAYDRKRLKIGKNTKAINRIDAGQDPNNSNRTVTVTPYYTYLYYEKNPSVNLNENVYVMVPSCGGIDINEGFWRCTNTSNSLVNEIKDNKAVYNGTVRSMWGLPNFGFFDHDDLMKTETKNLKNPELFPSNQCSSNFRSVYELLNVFEKKELDYFEELFLGFCDPNATKEQVYPFEGDIVNASYTKPFSVPDATKRRLKDQIINLLSITSTQVNITGDETKDGMSLADTNSKLIFSKVDEFVKNDVILKIGNPLNFNRKVLGSITTNTSFKVDNAQNFGPYINGTLPGDGSTETLINSQNKHKDAWNALKLNVGIPSNNTNVISDTEQKIKEYSDAGNEITKFFSEMNINFTKENIENLAPLIKLYAIKKNKTPSLTKTDFENTINQIIQRQFDNNTKITDQIFSKLKNNLPDNDLQKQNVRGTVSGNVNKLATYTTLQAFNNRWTAGSEVTERTLFEDFLFVNTASSDVGDLLTLDVEMVKNVLKSSNDVSIGDVISTILEKDQTSVMFATPAYVNFYGLPDASPKAKPIDTDPAQSVFGTFTEVNYLDSRQKFIIQYIGNKSEIPSQKNNKNVLYQDDAYDIGDPANCAVRIPDNAKIDYSKNNRIVAFNVDFALRNQNIFKDISIETSNMKNTSATFQFNENLANGVNGDQIGQQTQSLYSFYKSQSYTCSVNMLGCAMIQPTMYFNLRHVPLFYGPYLIHKVTHDISPGSFKTSIEGTRQPRYSLPQPDRALTFVAKNYSQIFKEKIFAKNPVRADENIADQVTLLDPGNLPDITFTSEENCRNAMSANSSTFTSDFVAAVEVSANYNSLNNYLKSKSVPSILCVYIMGKITNGRFNRVESTDNVSNKTTLNPLIFTYNNNFLNFSARNIFPPSNLPSNELICIGDRLNSEPLFSFVSSGSCLDKEISYSAGIAAKIDSIKNELKTRNPNDEDDALYTSALTFTYVAESTSNLSLTTNEIIDLTIKNLDKGTLAKSSYDYFYQRFFYSYTLENRPKCIETFAEITEGTLSSTTVSIQWTVPVLFGVDQPPANGYEYRNDTNNNPPSFTDNGTAISVLTVDLTLLSPNTTYYFWIRSKCASPNKSSWSGPLSYTTTSS